MVGTTRSPVNSLLNKFRKLRFLKNNGGMEINTSDQQVAAAKQWFAYPRLGGIVRL